MRNNTRVYPYFKNIQNTVYAKQYSNTKRKNINSFIINSNLKHLYLIKSYIFIYLFYFKSMVN